MITIVPARSEYWFQTRPWTYSGRDFERFLPRRIGMVNPIITLLFPLKSVIPVVFTLNPGFLSWIFPPNFPLSTNKDAEKAELFFCGVNRCKDPGRFWKLVPKGLKGGYDGKSGFVESERSDGTVMPMNWETDVTTNTDKTSNNPAFS